MTPPISSRQTVQCPTCGHAVPAAGRETAFCPHCGRPLRPRRRPRTAALVGWCTLAVVAVVGGVMWQGSRPPLATQALNALNLTPADPVDATLAGTDAACVVHVADLDRRADGVRTVRQSLVDQAADLANLSARVTTAVNRAADEDRWPAKVGGRSLLRADANDLLARIAATLATERRAIDHDTMALDRITAAATAVRAESADIGRLRGELATASPDRRPEIGRRAAAYEDGLADLPTAVGQAADVTRPVDVDALIH